MVKDLLLTVSMSVFLVPLLHLCENFAKGSCTFGDRCHFAHGAMILFFELVLARSIIIINAVDVVVHCYLVVGTRINFPFIVLPN